MPFEFSHPKDFAPGDLFLGLDQGRPAGVDTERHAITFAGSGMGKGAGVFIPNLLRWPHNVLCIDPKGENAARSFEAREKMGQRVCVIDPFRFADVPDRLRASFNPLDGIDPDSRRVREDISVLADGLMLRHDPKAGHWDGGALSVLAGFIAHVIASAPPEMRNLPTVRELMTLPADDFDDVVKAMGESDGVGGLAKAAFIKMKRSGSEGGHFLSAADENSKWLDSEPIQEVMSSSTFKLSDLKTEKLDVFLVLPFDLLEEHSRFLRVFVRCAINEMVKQGQEGRKCLFLLDEFFSLGYMAELAKAPGTLRSYGVKLWPFLQDIGQLRTLYGREGAGTFFANSDVAMFFGNTDDETLSYISQRLGVFRTEELVDGAPKALTPDVTDQTFALAHRQIPRPSGQGPIPLTGKKDGAAQFYNMIFNAMENSSYASSLDRQVQAQYELELGRMNVDAMQKDQTAEYQHKMQAKGAPRFYPDEVAELVGKGDGDKVAGSMIVFGKKGEVFNLQLAPYFEPLPVAETSEEPEQPAHSGGGVFDLPERAAGFWSLRADTGVGVVCDTSDGLSWFRPAGMKTWYMIFSEEFVRQVHTELFPLKLNSGPWKKARAEWKRLSPDRESVKLALEDWDGEFCIVDREGTVCLVTM